MIGFLFLTQILRSNLFRYLSSCRRVFLATINSYAILGVIAYYYTTMIS